MKKYFLIILLVLSIIGISACGSEKTQPTVEPAISEPQGVIAEGRLLPVHSVEMVFTSSGQVAELFIKNGDQVEAGQVLARLVESPEASTALGIAQQEEIASRLALEEYKASADLHLANAQLAILAAQEELDTAQTRYDSYESDENKAKLLAAENTLQLAENAQKQIEENDGLDPDLLSAAEARFSAAQASVRSAQNAVDSRELISTMAGTVSNVNLTAGQWVTAFTPVMSVADLSQWIVKTDNVTEFDVVSLDIGQKVTVILDALPDLSLSGEISEINPQYEEKRGDITYTVSINLDDSDPQMRWGMTGAVEFLP